MSDSSAVMGQQVDLCAAESPRRTAARQTALHRTVEAPQVPLAVVGCDFRVASSAWRNRLLLTASQRQELTEALRVSCGAEGLVVLETCNRVEWIVVSPAAQWAAEIMRAQMVERWLPLSVGRPSPVPYLYTGASAVTHLLRVAVGLESFVVGEREIAGQLNRAVVSARSGGHASTYHNALQTAVGRTVKKVQRLTRWRHHVRGVHGLAFDTIRMNLPQTPERRRKVAVIGMGEIGRKAAGLLLSIGGYDVIRVNRTVPVERQHEWLPLATHLGPLLETVDAIVVATGAAEPTVDLTDLGRRRKERLIAVDLGAPAQIRLPADDSVAYHGLDQLLSLPSVAPHEADLQAVLELVGEGAQEFLVECKKRDLAGLLRAAHDSYERFSYEVMPAFVEAELSDVLDVDRRRKMQAQLRDLLRDYSREIVQQIEAAAQAQTQSEP